MRMCIRMITGVCLFSVAVGLRSAQATTVVIKLESKRIILAADTRGNALDEFSNPTTKLHSTMMFAKLRS